MPELPEVETVRRQLNRRLQGKLIERVEVIRSGRETPVGIRFTRALTGQRILSIDRRAKLLIWHLQNGQAVTAHLKMTGRFVFERAGYVPQKHDRIFFFFQGLNGPLVWSDVRQFGFMHVVSADELEKIVTKYGPEPLGISVEELAACLHIPGTRRVKIALMDQTNIAGVGNIYADEACFRAKVRPGRKLGQLKPKERQLIAQEVQNVLRESITQQGTSANDYVDTKGEKGGFLESLQVYGREKELCVRCKTPIKKIVLGQRGTHYCPSCQK